MASNGDGALRPDEARRVYNRIGRYQDWQSFYEAPPVDDLIAHGGFPSARAVYEMGCGTGALAQRLLTNHLGPAASYLATDISDTMLRLSSERLAPWADRSEVRRVDGSLPLPGADGEFDRFVAAYVFDLFDGEYATATVEEARRLLAPGGKLCAVGLTEGTTRAGRVVGRVWRWTWERSPKLVGGCRPISLEPLLGDGWHIDHHRVVTAWGVPSEVVVATAV